VIFKNRKGQITGQVKDGIYEQHLKRGPHTFHSDGALAIDTEHLQTLKAMDVSLVKKMFDNGETFVAHVTDFGDFGYEKQFGQDNGPQTFLAIRYWHYHHEAQMSLF